MPAPKFQPVELRIGYEPVSELYESIWGFLATLMPLVISGACWVSSRRQKTKDARQAIYGGIPVPKSL